MVKVLRGSPFFPIFIQLFRIFVESSIHLTLVFSTNRLRKTVRNIVFFYTYRVRIEGGRLAISIPVRWWPVLHPSNWSRHALPAAASSATCRAQARQTPSCSKVVQTAPLVTAAVPAAANAAASSLLDLVFSTLPVPPPSSNHSVTIPWKTLLPFQSATTQRRSQDEWREG